MCDRGETGAVLSEGNIDGIGMEELPEKPKKFQIVKVAGIRWHK